MKGLKKYIQKHGKHFTEKLAYDAVRCKWDIKQISRTTQRKVWYNVTESTSGDILFLTNLAGSFGESFLLNSKAKCIDFALSLVGNMEYTGTAFDMWLSEMKRLGKDFDFSSYIE